MKTLLALLLLTAVTTEAQVLRTFTGNRRADEVNRKVIDPKSLNLNVLPSSTYGTTVSPLTDGRVASPIVDTRQRDLGTVRLGIRATSVTPQKNFAVRRTPESDRRGPSAIIKTPAAPITDRTITATTPAGEADLKEQLRRLRTK